MLAMQMKEYETKQNNIHQVQGAIKGGSDGPASIPTTLGLDESNAFLLHWYEYQFVVHNLKDFTKFREIQEGNQQSYHFWNRPSGERQGILNFNTTASKIPSDLKERELSLGSTGPGRLKETVNGPGGQSCCDFISNILEEVLMK